MYLKSDQMIMLEMTKDRSSYTVAIQGFEVNKKKKIHNYDSFSGMWM